MIWHFNANVSMTFIYTIHPTSFDYGSLLNVSQILQNRSAYNDRHIMVSLINTVI